MFYKQFVLLCAAMAFTAFSCFSNETPTTSDVAADTERHLSILKTRINEILQETKTPGAAVVMVDNGKVLLSEGFGLANVLNNKPADADTLFRIGSISKMFVALAALKLQEEGRLNIDDTLKSVAPEITFINPWEDTHPVRLRHLMAHTSGFYDSDFKDSPDPRPNNLLDALSKNPGARVSRWPPGTAFSYSNIGPPIVAYAIEKIVAMPYEEYIQQSFFDPLGMKGATFFQPPADSNITALYKKESDTPIDYWHDSLRPSGALNASANDLAQLLLFFLDRGVSGEKVILSPRAFDIIEQRQDVLGYRAGLKSAPGLGSLNYGDNWKGHGGDISGAHSLLRYKSENKIGLAVSINTDSDAREKITNLVIEYLNLAPESRIEYINKLESERPEPHGSDSGRETEDYSEAEIETHGKYFNDDIVRQYDGFYKLVTIRQKIAVPFNDLFDSYRLSLQRDEASFGVLNVPRKYYLSSEKLLARKGSEQPNIALLDESYDANILISVGLNIYRKTSFIEAFVVYIILSLGVVSSVVFAGAWGRQFYLARKGLEHVTFGIRMGLAFLASWLVPFAFVGVVSWGSSHPAELGSITFVSSTILIASMLVLVAPLLALWFVKGNLIRSGFSVIKLAMIGPTIFSFMFALLLLVYGVIPLITWN